METNYNYDDAAYNQLLEDADKDDRIGHHTVVVNGVVDDTWPSGDPRRKIKFAYLDVKNAKADLTISPPPSPEVVASESKTWDTGKKKAVAQTINIYRQLRKHYNKSPETVIEGDVFRVNVVKTTIKKDGTGGFLRVTAFLAKDEKTEAASTDSPPF